MAWSFDGRHTPGCAPGHKTEANCRRHALTWRAAVLDTLERGTRRCEQPALFPAHPRHRRTQEVA